MGWQGGRGHWAAYYTSPQSFINMFSTLLDKQILGLGFDWLVHLLDCPNVSTIIVIHRRDNFVYCH